MNSPGAFQIFPRTPRQTRENNMCDLTLEFLLDLGPTCSDAILQPPDLIIVSFELRVGSESPHEHRLKNSADLCAPDAVHAFIHFFIHRPNFLSPFENA